jgi:uncharacterized protein YdeI (BOF family)
MKEKGVSSSDAVANVLDFIRGTVKAKNCKEMIQILNKLKHVCDTLPWNFKIVRIKNGFTDLSKKCYKSIMVNLMVYEAMICEIQITLDKIKDVGNFDHFIYETVREKTLYDVVGRFLNNFTPYKEWLEPLLPKDQVLRYPDRLMQWKGFFIRDRQRLHLDFDMKLSEDGKVSGSGKAKHGSFKIEGNHVNFKSITFTKIMDAGKRVFYKGTFVDSITIEGNYTFGKASDYFRIWISDDLFPGLSVIQDNIKNKKNFLPYPMST